MKKSAADDLYNIVIASKLTQKYQEIYRLIVQLAVMAVASSKTEMTPCGHVFPGRVYIHGECSNRPCRSTGRIKVIYALFRR